MRTFLSLVVLCFAFIWRSIDQTLSVFRKGARIRSPESALFVTDTGIAILVAVLNRPAVIGVFFSHRYSYSGFDFHFIPRTLLTTQSYICLPVTEWKRGLNAARQSGSTRDLVQLPGIYFYVGFLSPFFSYFFHFLFLSFLGVPVLLTPVAWVGLVIFYVVQGCTYAQ